MRKSFSIFWLTFAIALFAATSSWAQGSSSYNLTTLISKIDLEPFVGGPLLDAKIDSNDLSVVRYSPLHGTPYLEAVIVSMRAFDPVEYVGLVDMAKKVSEYKHEVNEIGDKAFWKENITYGSLEVQKDRILIEVTVSQSMALQTKEQAAIGIARIVLARLLKN